MFDRIITVALNPSIDVTLWPESCHWGEPNRCSREKVYAGGKAINVTRVLQSLNSSARLLGIAGKENVRLLRTLLDEDSLDYLLLETAGAVRENMTVITPQQQVLTVNRQGIPIENSVWLQLIALLKNELIPDGSNLVVFAGSLPINISAADYKEMILTVKAPNVAIALDTDFFTLADLQEIEPFLVKPNLSEARSILGCPDLTAQNAVCRVMALSGIAEHVLLSLGAEGLCYCHQGRGCRILVPEVAVSSTVGAGDTALAGFLAGLQQGKNAQESAVYAAACSCASVTLEGTAAVTPRAAACYVEQIRVIPESCPFCNPEKNSTNCQKRY